jgi:hypothetical protein
MAKESSLFGSSAEACWEAGMDAVFVSMVGTSGEIFSWSS